MLQATLESLNRRLGWGRMPSAGRRIEYAVEMIRPPLEATPEDLAAAVDALYTGKVPAHGGPVDLLAPSESACCNETHAAMFRRAINQQTPFSADCKCGAVYRVVSRFANE